MKACHELLAAVTWIGCLFLLVPCRDCCGQAYGNEIGCLNTDLMGSIKEMRTAHSLEMAGALGSIAVKSRNSWYIGHSDACLSLVIYWKWNNGVDSYEGNLIGIWYWSKLPLLFFWPGKFIIIHLMVILSYCQYNIGITWGTFYSKFF